MNRSRFSRNIHPLLAFLILSLNFSTTAFSASPVLKLTKEEVAASLAPFLKRAEELKLWEDPEWKMLGYYDKGLFGTKSRSSDSFFLSPEGETDPKAELLATIQNLYSIEERVYVGAGRTEEKQIPRCQFPARYRWLEKQLGIDESHLPTIQCELLNKFRARMGGKAASVVFSSFYMNNPSSSFGHSLLRISQVEASDPNSERLELLDFGLGYAADSTTPNPLLYAIYGIGGVFHGTYTNIPYYYKVREYNDAESRDLWSYHLNLTPDELTMLVDRIWEIGSTWHHYYYFTFNCSNVILHALQTAAPRYNILDELKYYVIPSDTIKAIMRVPGLVTKVTYRPSAYSVFKRRTGAMNSEETAALHQVIDSNFDKAELAKLDPKVAVHVLDASVDYIDYKYSKKMFVATTQESIWRQNVLVARAGIREKSESFTDFVPENERPDLGHRSAKVSLIGGREKGVEEYQQLNVRFALHDLLDPPTGYPANSHLEMIGIKVRRVNDARRIELEDLNFFRIMNLSPLTGFNRSTSWRAEFGGKRVRDENCSRCFATAGEFGVGYSVQPVKGVILYSLGEFGLRHAPSFAQSNLQIGAGPSAGVLVQIGHLGLLSSAKYQYQFLAAYPNTRIYSTELRYNVSQRITLSADGKIYTKTWDLGASIGIFL